MSMSEWYPFFGAIGGIFGEWLIKLDACTNVGHIAALLNEMPANIKADLKEHVGMKQDEIKAAQQPQQ